MVEVEASYYHGVETRQMAKRTCLVGRWRSNKNRRSVDAPTRLADHPLLPLWPVGNRVFADPALVNWLGGEGASNLRIPADYKPAIVYTAVVLVLLLRPSGLLRREIE